MTSYLWSTQSTYPSIIVPFAGTYWILVEDVNGCTNSDTIVIYEPTPEGINEYKQDGLEVSPNPVSDDAHITFKSPGVKYQLEIVSQNGQFVKSTVASDFIDIDCRELPSGIYYILATSDKDYFMSKLQVTH